MRWRGLAAAAIAIAAAVAAVPAPAQQVSELRLSSAPAAPISPLLYGVNYVWHLVPAGAYGQFNAILQNQIHQTLSRYPGGWVAEHFDWEKNAFLGTQRRPEAPGIDPVRFLSSVPQTSMVTPSLAAIQNQAKIPAVAQESVALVRRFGDRVKIWEIGNEWWLARGGKTNPAMRADNLQAYAALVRAEAAAMQAAGSGIRVYVTGDWTRPQEFAEIRRLAGEPAWAAVAGISFHSYCGPQDPERGCARIPERTGIIRSLTGKSEFYDSEWGVGRRLNREDFGIHNANATVLALQELALARVTAAAYWPPVRDIAATALICPDYQGPSATGVVFGWMAQYYRGDALQVSGDIAAAAARGSGGVTVFVPSAESGPRRVRIPLGPAGLSRVVSAQVLYSPNPEDRRACRGFGTAPLPVSVQAGAAEFTLNPGSAGRGAGWEIARVTLQ